MSRDISASLDAIMRAQRDRTAAGDNSMAAPKSRGAAPAEKSAALEPSGSATGGGIASPLTEQSRTYYSASTVASTDGIFRIRIKPIQSIVFTDAKQASVELKFSNSNQ